MDIKKLIEEGARVVERAAYDAFLFGDTSYRQAASALITLALRAAAEEAEKHRARVHGHHPDDPVPDRVGQGYSNAAFNIAVEFRRVAEQVEKANG